MKHPNSSSHVATPTPDPRTTTEISAEETGGQASATSAEVSNARRATSRRRFLREPVLLGGSMLALSALGSKAMAAGDSATPVEVHFDDDDPYQVRPGLGIVIVGASSGLGAEMARQYAEHGAYVVLAARRIDRLQQVADDVRARGGVPYVVPTDVRDEAQCKELIDEAIAWLATQGKAIDILAMGPLRAQTGAISPERSSGVWRNEIETHYFGAVFCLKYAVPHLKQHQSTVVYFNSVASSIPLPSAAGYTAMKHGWRGTLNVLQYENPELTVVSTYFNAIDTEAWDKGMTLFNNDKRYCPSPTRTYSIPTQNMYTAPFAIEKLLRAVETKTPQAFLSVLNQAAWMIGFTRVELGSLLATLEIAMPWPYKQQLDLEIKQALKGPGAAGYINSLLGKLRGNQSSNELLDAARYVMSMDESVAIYLLALEDQLDSAVLAGARQHYDNSRQLYANGTWQQFELAMSAGILSPSGITDDDDGFAPITHCPPAG